MVGGLAQQPAPPVFYDVELVMADDKLWEDKDFTLFKGGWVNGRKVHSDFRLLSEEEFQLAKRCVNAILSVADEEDEEPTPQHQGSFDVSFTRTTANVVVEPDGQELLP